MKQSFSDLQISVDAYAKKADAYLWIHQIAEKIGIKLEH